ncbi:hypothetical protein NHJ13051_006525, partial [Beauveria bassiana]
MGIVRRRQARICTPSLRQPSTPNYDDDDDDDEYPDDGGITAWTVVLGA